MARRLTLEEFPYAYFIPVTSKNSALYFLQNKTRLRKREFSVDSQKSSFISLVQLYKFLFG